MFEDQEFRFEPEEFRFEDQELRFEPEEFRFEDQELRFEPEEFRFEDQEFMFEGQELPRRLPKPEMGLFAPENRVGRGRGGRRARDDRVAEGCGGAGRMIGPGAQGTRGRKQGTKRTFEHEARAARRQRDPPSAAGRACRRSATTRPPRIVRKGSASRRVMRLTGLKEPGAGERISRPPGGRSGRKNWGPPSGGAPVRPRGPPFLFHIVTSASSRLAGSRLLDDGRHAVDTRCGLLAGWDRLHLSTRI